MPCAVSDKFFDFNRDILQNRKEPLVVPTYALAAIRRL